MKSIDREKIIDGLVERVVNPIKEEVASLGSGGIGGGSNPIKDVKIAIKHPDVSKRYKIGKMVREPIFLVKKKDMLAFAMFWDDYEFFGYPYTDLDFYIKSKMMQYTSFVWHPIWFDTLPSIVTDYNYDFDTEEKTNET